MPYYLGIKGQHGLVVGATYGVSVCEMEKKDDVRTISQWHQVGRMMDSGSG